MSTSMIEIGAEITDEKRAEARAYIESLRIQREKPLPILERLQNELPQYHADWEILSAYINFTSSEQESRLPIASKDIYTSVDRVVLELIRNADDAEYTTEEHETCAPYINFTLSPDTVILEYNENGFTRDHVDRICDINTSGKGKVDIGEKGIGFRSAFMIASKVHIESREYSFSFQFKEGDNAMQMFTPRYEVSDDPPIGFTRITLTLLEDQRIRAEALQKFREVPTTLLIFLRNIKRLSITENYGTRSSTVSTAYSESRDRGILMMRDGTTKLDIQKQFLIFKKVFSDIPTTGEEKKNPNAEVKLAFPLKSNDQPLIERQPDIFARLPISNTGVGLHFLVHSDFSISANQEAVDEKSERNAVLLDKIAELFQVAVKTFCSPIFSPFPHQWIEFLPDNSISDPFWNGLRIKIESKLAVTPFLRSSYGSVHLLSELRYVPKEFRDCFEEGSSPLFRDLLLDQKYLHLDYEAYLEKLRALGLKDLTPEDMVDRVEIDVVLKNPFSSMMRENDDERWHGRLALFLLHCRDNYPSEWARLQKLPLLPIIPPGPRNWTSNLYGEVYLPNVGDVPVPTDLNIRLATPDAASHPTRKRLFQVLGVDAPPRDLVRQLIFKKYECSNTIELEASVAHLQFLWWTHPKDHKVDRELYKKIRIFNQDNGKVDPQFKEIFFSSDHTFGVRKLLPNASGLILHRAYLEATWPSEQPGHPSWRSWLRDAIGVQEYPRLADRNKRKRLSPTFKKISKKFPNKVVGLLRAHWHEYNEQVNKSIKQKVSDIKIQRIEINGDSIPLGLKQSNLPSSTLLQICETVGVADTYPFLELPAEISDPNLTGWDFLTNFGVTIEPNFNFYVGLFDHFRQLKGPIVQKMVFKLYALIRSQFVEAGFDENGTEIVAVFHPNKKVVFVPTSPPGSFDWATPEDCLWDAPSYMETKIPLLARYHSITDAPLPIEFIRENLRVENITFTDLLRELESMKNRESHICVDNIKDIYVRLNVMRLTDGKISKMIKERFEKSGLVWIQSELGCWESPSSCLWSTMVQITDKHTISRVYGQGKYKETLKAFFVDYLGVTEPTLAMLAGELQLLANDKSIPVKRIKIIMEAISSMPLRKFNPIRKNLRSSTIFPVRLADGSRALESATGQFFISDREKYWKAFHEQLPMLEFNLEEVHELKPFLRWMGLENRYLSNRVTERSEFSGTPEECSEKLTKDFKFRATALFRCAIHFNSSCTQGQDASLFQLLSRAEVYQTSNISSFWDISQIIRGKKIVLTVPGSTSNFHIERKNKTELRIFVPSDEGQRVLSYYNPLPQKLLSEILMQAPKSNPSDTDQSAVGVLAAVLNAPRDEQFLEDLLAEFGIRGLPKWFEEDNAELSAGLAGSPTSSLSSSTGAVPRPPEQPSGLVASNSQPHGVLQSIIPQDSSTEESRFEGQSEYIKLLGRIRDAGREAQIPTRGSFNMSASANAPENDSSPDSPHPTTAFGNRSVNQLKHDKKIGAAGELFVYELLSHLPQFASGRKLHLNPSNWPSCIRDYVRVHPACAADFPEVENPNKREEADIIFDDEYGDFTQYLIGKEYLELEEYRGSKPIKYFIEVKTTLKKRETKFYMSASQYKLMQDTAAKRNDAVKSVYLVFRVFHLDTSNIGLYVYTNPAELCFTVEGYTVTPKES